MDIDFARRQMIDQQVRAWEVFDPAVLEVLAHTPRERFVPAGFESLAFADTGIPIGHGQTMMTPTVEGRLLQALELEADDSVLEIGTGSGYLTACLARLAGAVTSLEIHADFIPKASARLQSFGIDNVQLLEMDAMRELPGGQYDAIAVTGSLEAFDPRFVEVLKAGGRLFIVVGSPPVMDARLVRRTGNSDWQSDSLFETLLAPLVHGALPPRFTF